MAVRGRNRRFMEVYVKAPRMLLVACSVALVLVTGTSISAAAPSPAASCVGYPPSVGAMVSVSTTELRPDQSLAVTGRNFAPNRPVAINIDTAPATVLARVTTDAHGSFSADLTIPSVPAGSYTISTSAGASTATCTTNPITVVVEGVAPSGGHRLGNTGVDILAGLGIALGLLGAGLVLTRAGRRGNGARAAHH